MRIVDIAKIGLLFSELILDSNFWPGVKLPMLSNQLKKLLRNKLQGSIRTFIT